jgi:uridine kinase
MSRFIIGIAGGTGSGKTTVANEIIKRLGINNVSYICHDNYYKDLSNLSEFDQNKVNFDHPNSLDTELMIEDIFKLYNGNTIHIPIYDFKTHRRLPNTKIITPQPIIIIEGILIFNNIKLRNMINLKIFVDTEADERFIRRIRRDIHNRARDLDSIIKQYVSTVKPMHQQFVEPSKVYSDIIIPSGYNKNAVEMLVISLQSMINKKKDL